jgi:hypothetical protein
MDTPPKRRPGRPLKDTLSTVALNADIQALKRVRHWLDDPAHWTQGWSARKSDDSATNPASDTCEKTCLLGACRRFDASPHHLLERLKRDSHDWQSIADWNDEPGRTHAEIYRLVTRTIHDLQRRLHGRLRSLNSGDKGRGDAPQGP